jgi:hypothetical protein
MAVIVTLVVGKGRRRRSLALLECAHARVKHGILRVVDFIRAATFRCPHELLSTNCGRWASTKAELLEVHTEALSANLLRRLGHVALAGLA